MGKIAILVLGNQQGATIRTFAQTCGAERFNFYVHLDARRDLEAYFGPDPMPSHVRAIEERFPIYWGGFNMIRATEALASRASADPDNEVFALVSDDSFPLLSPDRLYDAIMTEPLRIDTWRAQDNQKTIDRYAHFFHFDSLHGHARHLEPEQRFIRLQDFQVYERLPRLMERGKYPITLHSGSQWWIMPRRILSECLAQLSQNLHLRESFEFSAIPDELAFQTLVRAIVPADVKVPPSAMCYDFSKAPKPFVYSSLDELDPKLTTGKLFIRKVKHDTAFLEALLAR